jgi:hypothetical protein
MSHISTLGRFFLSMSLVAGSFALAPNMQAQQGSITARVPFAFSANNQQFEAGQYEIRPLNAFVLLLSNTTTHHSQYLLVNPSGMRDIQDQGRLLFHEVNGNQHSLYEVWMPGRSEFSELRPTRRDRQAVRAQN